MRHRADELAVFDDGRAAQECGQVGTTVFNEKITKSAESGQMATLGGSIISFVL